MFLTGLLSLSTPTILAHSAPWATAGESSSRSGYSPFSSPFLLYGPRLQHSDKVLFNCCCPLECIHLLLCQLHTYHICDLLQRYKRQYRVRTTCCWAEKWNLLTRIYFTWYQLIVTFIIPSLVMITCYSTVIHSLRRATNNMVIMTNR